MSVSGELSFYTENIRTGLMSETLKPTSDLPALLSAFAQYKSGDAGEGQNINRLLSAPHGQWYGGRDTLRSQEAGPQVNRHFSFWGNFMIPVSIDFEHLSRITGITSAEFLSPDFSLNRLNEKGRLAFFSNLQTAYQSSVYGSLLDYQRSLWGNLIPGDAEERMPEHLGDLFNPDGVWHGLGPDELGTFDQRHALGRNPTQYPQWNKVHAPRIFYFNYEDNAVPGTKPPDGTDAVVLTRENIFEKMSEFLRPWNLIVKGNKLMPLPTEVFGLLGNSKEFVGVTGSDKFPLVIYNGMGWEHTIEVVKMHNVLLYEETDAPTDEFWGLHLGNPGDGSGTFYPYFWEDDYNLSARNKLGQMVREQSRAMPTYNLGGGTRPLPLYTDEMYRFTGNADAGGTNLRVRYMFICPARWCQTIGRGWTV